MKTIDLYNRILGNKEIKIDNRKDFGFIKKIDNKYKGRKLKKVKKKEQRLFEI